MTFQGYGVLFPYLSINVEYLFNPFLYKILLITLIFIKKISEISNLFVSLSIKKAKMYIFSKFYLGHVCSRFLLNQNFLLRFIFHFICLVIYLPSVLCFGRERKKEVLLRFHLLPPYLNWHHPPLFIPAWNKKILFC